MYSRSRHLSCWVAVGTATLLVGGCSDSGSHADGSAPTEPTSSAATPGVSPKQRYLDTVNDLCDQLLTKVVRVTDGGSIDIPARQYLRQWPAHRQVLAGFDTSLAKVPVPAGAAPAAAAMRDYVAFADRLDATRLTAARRGEQAWRHEVAAEADIESAPAIAARNRAGFAASCDAR